MEQSYPSIDAAVAAIPTDFPDAIASYRRGKRVVVIGVGSVHILEGREGDRHWAEMRRVVVLDEVSSDAR